MPFAIHRTPLRGLRRAVQAEEQQRRSPADMRSHLRNQATPPHRHRWRSRWPDMQGAVEDLQTLQSAFRRSWKRRLLRCLRSTEPSGVLLEARTPKEAEIG